MNNKLQLALVVSGLALAGTAFAHGDNKMQSMDTNGDGQISSAEHAAGVTKMYAGMDANKDGEVTASEMDAYSASKGGSSMKMSSADKIKTMDTNGDGKLSASEHDTGANAMFAKMDTDGNGSLSQSEMAAGHSKADKAKADHADHSDMHDHGTSAAASGSDATTPPDGN
jgi:Ca2+-binding EF-hand superfamily protein